MAHPTVSPPPSDKRTATPRRGRIRRKVHIWHEAPLWVHVLIVAAGAVQQPACEQLRIAGKVVDCLLDDIDVDHWHGAMFALTSELKRQDADVVQAYASAPWTVEALGEVAMNRDLQLSFISATARV